MFFPKQSLNWKASPVVTTFLILGGLLSLGMILLLFFGLLLVVTQGEGRGGANKVAVIRITGLIVSSGGRTMTRRLASSESIVDQLESAGKARSVKAVVLRINSPGGSAAASQEIYSQICQLKKSGKPVIASLGDVAASGGYYIASAANRIVANPASLTGSIGVIMELQNLQLLLKKIGIGIEVIKSGPHKDLGSPARSLTAQERVLLQNMINDVYHQFVTDVSAGRKMNVTQVKKLADGRLYTGRQAKTLGLVDELGGFKEALELAARQAGLKEKPQILEFDRTSFWQQLLETTTETVVSSLSEHWSLNGSFLGESFRSLSLLDERVAR